MTTEKKINPKDAEPKDYCVFRFLSPNKHTRAVAPNWIIDVDTCYYPNISATTKVNKLLNLKAIPYDEKANDWQAFRGKLLKTDLCLNDAKKKAEQDGTYNYKGNLTSGDEDHSKRRKPKKFDDFETSITGSPEESVLPKFPKSPGHVQRGTKTKNDKNKSDQTAVIGSPGHIRQLFGAETPKKGRRMSLVALESSPLKSQSEHLEIQKTLDTFEERPKSPKKGLGMTAAESSAKHSCGSIKIFDSDIDYQSDISEGFEAESPRKVRGWKVSKSNTMPKPTLSNSAQESSSCYDLDLETQSNASGSFCTHESPKKEREKAVRKYGINPQPASKSANEPIKRTRFECEPSGDGSNWSQAEFQRYVVKHIREIRMDLNIIKTGYIKRKSEDTSDQSPKKQKVEQFDDEIKKVSTLDEVVALNVELLDDKKRSQWVKRASLFLSSFVSDVSGASHAGRIVINHVFSTSGKLVTCYAGRAPGKFKLEGSNIGKALIGIMLRLGYKDPKIISKVLSKPLYKANDCNTRHKKKSPKKKSPEKKSPEKKSPEKRSHKKKDDNAVTPTKSPSKSNSDLTLETLE